MADKEKAISLIKKILAKAQNNPNEHEVEVAMLKAQEAMVKHGLSFADIDDIGATPKKEVVRDEITDTERIVWWVWELGDIIGKNFRCNCIKKKKSGKGVLSFIGLSDDVLIAKELFVFARESLDYFADAYITRLCDDINLTPIRQRPPHQQKVFTMKDFTDDRNDYIKGFLKGLDEKFKEQVARNNWGLILVKDNAVIEAVNKLHCRSVAIPSADKGRGNKTHFDAGFKDGYSLQHRKDLLAK